LCGVLSPLPLFLLFVEKLVAIFAGDRLKNGFHISANKFPFHATVNQSCVDPLLIHSIFKFLNELLSKNFLLFVSEKVK